MSKFFFTKDSVRSIAFYLMLAVITAFVVRYVLYKFLIN